jgi:hypothetical protein
MTIWATNSVSAGGERCVRDCRNSTIVPIIGAPELPNGHFNAEHG